MIIPYTLFLGLYLFGVLFIIVYVTINLLHVIRLSNFDTQAIAVTFIFLAGLFFILFMSYRSLIKIDWHKKIDVMGNIQSSWQEFNPL